MFFVFILALLGLVHYLLHRRISRDFALQKRARVALGIVLAVVAIAPIAGRLALGAGIEVAPLLYRIGMTASLAVIVTGGLLIIARLVGWTADGLWWLSTRVLSAGTARRAQAAVPQQGEASVEATDTKADEASDGEARRPEPNDELNDEPRAPKPESEDKKPSLEPEETRPVVAPALPPTLWLPASRRNFLRRTVTGSALLAGTAAASYGAIFGRIDYTIEDVELPVRGLSPKLEGYTIAQLSDIHFGTMIGDRELAAAESLVRDIAPDLVVLTGDLVDHDPRYAPFVGKLVERLRPLTRDGLIAALGNHDYYTGIRAVADSLVRGGARILRNEGMIIGSEPHAFALLGVDDVWATRRMANRSPDLDRAIAQVPRDLPRVLLCHNPVFFDEAKDRVDAMLSGHTHGGQVNLILRPADLVLRHGFVAGLYREQGTSLYVNRGFGTAGPPARVQAPPEVSRIRLVAG